MRQIILALFALGFLLSSCTPTASAGTSSSASTRTSRPASVGTSGSPGYRNSGLSKHTDQFTGKTVCEQKVTSLRDPHNLTITARLDEHGVYTFSLTRHNLRDLQDFVYTPYSEAGLLLRFPNSNVVRGYVVAKNDADFVPGEDSSWYQTHTLIVKRIFFSDLVSATQGVSYRLVDNDDATRSSVDGVLTVQHLAPLKAFFAQCL